MARRTASVEPVEKVEPHVTREESMVNPSHPPLPTDRNLSASPVVSPVGVSEADFTRAEMNTKAMLDAQPKRPIRLHQVPKDSTDTPLPDEHVTVNGHGYLIQRGVDVEVPQTVYEILVQAGRY